jgi:hypothetical protein
MIVDDPTRKTCCGTSLTELLLGVDRDHIARARARGRRGEGQRNMPLTLEELQEIQADLMADDIEIVRLQKLSRDAIALLVLLCQRKTALPFFS